MAYTPTVWETGDIITAEKLNHMEGGIDANDTAVLALDANIGEMSALDTTAKNSLVAAVNEVNSDVSNVTDAAQNILDKYNNVIVFKNIVEGVLDTTIANIDGSYVLYPSTTDKVIYFPVVNGNTYTVYKGYSMASCRIGYSSTKPKENDVVTGYADFSSVLLYNTFTASATGYACVKITYSGDVTTADNVLATACAYDGAYDATIGKNSTDLINIKSINGAEWSEVDAKVESVQYRNIIEGYLDAQVTTVITQSTNGTKLSVYFPVTQGHRYTLDKKYFTHHTRIGYTTNKPNYGDSVSNFTLLDGGNGSEHVTFTALQSGYGVLWLLDTATTTTVSIAQEKANAIVYEGDYRKDYTQDTLYIVNDVSNIQHVFYCGTGRELSTLKAGIEKATQYMDSILYVDPGTYDLVSEFGQTWFDSLTDVDLAGIVLKNGIHVIFSPNSKVVSNYSGSNQYAQSKYSPFNVGEYGFTMENLNLECSRCRYAVHDERNAASEQYHSIYKNCKMSIDNSDNAYWTSHHCIGGGLGANAQILIENCLFESDVSDNRWGVYYHIPNNSNVSSYRAIVVIKDNYFITGAITLDDVASTPTSTSDDSEFIITNNSFPVKYAGTDDQGVYNALTKSYKLRDWANSFRSS